MPDEKSNLLIDVRVGETVNLPGNVSVQVVEKSGRTARLRFIAPKDARICKATPRATVPSMANSTLVK